MTDKRPAYEPVARLFARPDYDPGMKRPAATIAGAGLVMLSAGAGVLWLGSLALVWPELVRSADATLDLSPADRDGALVGTLVVGGAVLAAEVLLAVLIYRGVNWARVVVMVFAVVAISSSFTLWWAGGQEFGVDATLLTLALDVLVLLALSSRDAAAYARRRERRPPE